MLFKRGFLIFFTGVLLSASLMAGGESRGSLHLELDGFKNNRGQAMIALYANPAGFLKKNKTPFRISTRIIRNGRVRVTLKDLPFKVYALAVYHDENSNGKLDRNMLGIPAEDYGFSNNVRGRFGPPSFQAASFSLAAKNKNLRIRVK